MEEASRSDSLCIVLKDECYVLICMEKNIGVKIYTERIHIFLHNYQKHRKQHMLELKFSKLKRLRMPARFLRPNLVLFH